MAEFKTWEILRKGTYPQGDITEEMIKEMVKNFKKNGDIPIGKGHSAYWWRDDLPAEGWINVNQKFGMDKKGSLVSNGIELLEPLATEYAERKYRNWSAVIARPVKDYDKKEGRYIYGEWELRAVDVLGRSLPAIKNLRDLTENKKKPSLSLSEEEVTEEISFSEDFKTSDETESIIELKNGSKYQVMVFSDAINFNYAEANNEEENKEETDIENEEQDNNKQENEMKNDLSAKPESVDNSARIAELEAKNKEYEERTSLILQQYKASEEKKLDEVLPIPAEMKAALYSALSEIPVEMSFGEKKESIYALLAGCIKQLNYTDNVVSKEMDENLQKPDEKQDDSEGKKIYSSAILSLNAIGLCDQGGR